MKSILVATDFSKGAENAVKYAKEIAVSKSQKLIYVHIVNMPIVDPIVSSNVVAETIEELKSGSEQRLKEMTQNDKANGLNSEYRISFNDIIDLIDEIGKTEEVDLVVVGKTGHRTFLDKILGSTAQGLMNQIKQPLLVIPEEYNGPILDKLCYASKLEFNEKKYIAQALEWRSYSDNDLIIGHILEEFPLDINENEQFIASIDREFENKGYVYKNFAADFYSDGIVEFTEKEGISLLFVTTQKRGFFEGIIDPSKTKAMINKVNVPVIVFSYVE
jgi:nucleotide-binding universal stress UspA family protein